MILILIIPYVAAETQIPEFYIPGENYSSSQPQILPDVPSHLKGGVVSPEEGSVTWEFSVTQNGLYNIEIGYVNIPGRGTSIERTILINGKLPYRELSYVRFPRLWENIFQFGMFDENGNSIRPSYREVEEFRSVFIRDSAGYFTEPLGVYLETGKHTITLLSEREPMFIQYIRFIAAPSPPVYYEYISTHLTNGLTPARHSR